MDSFLETDLYIHFMLLTQYCLWKEDAPGIGYRENTDVNGIPARQTVGYTLGRIYEDLELAESALKEAGRTTFDFKHNFRRPYRLFRLSVPV